LQVLREKISKFYLFFYKKAECFLKCEAKCVLKFKPHSFRDIPAAEKQPDRHAERL